MKKLNEIKISGVSLPLYAFIVFVLAVTIAMGKLPLNMLGLTLLLVVMGHVLYFIGEKLPIMNSYLGGGSVFTLLGATLLATFHIIPKDIIVATKGFLGDDVVVVSPDVGGVKRARKLAEKLDCKIAIIDKRRPKPNVAEVMNLIGEVEGKIAIFIDDMIDTAGTITNGADAIAQRGAKEVYACCSHAVFSDPAIERLEKSALKEVIVTDSIALPERKKIDKIKILSVDSVFAAAIDRITNNKSVSELFE